MSDSDTVMYCPACELCRTPNSNGDCPECGELLWPVKHASDAEENTD